MSTFQERVAMAEGGMCPEGKRPFGEYCWQEPFYLGSQNGLQPLPWYLSWRTWSRS